jgi:dihydrofolate reductase
MKTLSLIYAVSENHVIGDGNKLPWHLPADFKHFKEATSGHPVIMGRRTFESIGRPLPGRQNIVLTHNLDYQADGVTIVHSLEDAISQAEDDDIFVIGGVKVFEEALPQAVRIYETRVHALVAGDVLFEPDLSHWLEEEHQDYSADDKNNYGYSFITYVRQ